jgi:flagellar protein FliO/FliZ
MDIGTILSSVFAVVIVLALVLGIAWGVIWLLKKLQDRQLGTSGTRQEGRAIRFIRSMPLGQRERVAMIDVGGETMLLGVTAGSITLLARWPGDETPDFPSRPGPAR